MSMTGLTGLNYNGRCVNWALEMAPERDGWTSAESDGWLMTGPANLPHATAAALKVTLHALARRGVAELRTGSDGQLYARRANRTGATENETLLGPLMLFVWDDFLSDYSPGLAVVLAHDVHGARRMLMEQNHGSASARQSLAQQPQVVTLGPDTRPQCWHVAGGS